MKTIIYIIGNKTVLEHLSKIKTELDSKGLNYKLTPIKKTNLGHYETELFIQNTNETEITNFDLMAFISEHKAIIGNIKIRKDILKHYTPIRTHKSKRDKALELLKAIDRTKSQIKDLGHNTNIYAEKKQYSELNHTFRENNTMTLKDYEQLKRNSV